MSLCDDSNIKKTYIVQSSDSSDFFSACTELYTNQLLPCTGDTINVNGNFNILGNITGSTFYGDGSNLTGVSSQDTFVTGATYYNNTFTYINNSGGTFDVLFNTLTGLTINGDLLVTGNTEVTGDITPTTDNISNLGTSIKRFRDINTVSGTSTVWTSTIRVITPELDLGLDSSGNTRIITADNSIIQNDTLLGGTY